MQYETTLSAAFKAAATKPARRTTVFTRAFRESVGKAASRSAGVMPVADATKGAGGPLVRSFYPQ